MAIRFKPELDMPVATALRLFLLDRLGEFEWTAARLMDPNRDAVIDAVHDLRVICRQVLSLMSAFSPYLRERSLRPIKRNIRRINGYLGPLRDLDILLTRSELDSTLRGRIEQQRTEALSSLLHVINGKKYQEMIGTMISPLLLPDADSHLAPTAVTANGRVLMRQLSLVVPEILYRLAAAVAAYQTVVRPFEPESNSDTRSRSEAERQSSADSLHRLRISCKRFRYVLTMLRPLFGSHADSLIQSIKMLQDQLGCLHDQQMLIEVIGSQKKAAGSVSTDTAVWTSIQQSYEKILSDFYIVWQPCDQAWMHQQIRPLLDILYRTDDQTV